MKAYQNQDGTIILDFGSKSLLIHIPVGLAHRREFDPKKYTEGNSPWYNHIGGGLLCGGYTKGTTAKGRQIIRLRAGNSHLLVVNRSSGDRGWNGWDHFKKLLETTTIADKGFSFAVPTSNGGGCWCECHCYLVDEFPCEYTHTGRPLLNGKLLSVEDIL